ncbi:hypothetical protein Q1695_014192 [Nippostrongylus brasiliensis]|nr:hypothetical protein Q1695_014192 [Nippostrongylus brasiliensis]
MIYVPASSENMVTIEQGLYANLVLFALGLFCFFLNVPLLYTLLKSSKLRSEAKMLILMAFGDSVNCLAISALGLYRYNLYSTSARSGQVPLQTARTCAERPSMWLRLLGNTWPPTVTLLMGIERIVASMLPMLYVKNTHRKSIVVTVVTAVTLILFCVIGLVLVLTSSDSRKVKFDCGRKATFGASFGVLIYCYEIFGYVAGLVLSIVAYYQTRSVMSNDSSRSQLKRIRAYIAVAAISTVLVAVPDVKQLLINHLKDASFDEWISQAFNWLCLIASSFNIFVYLVISKEFRCEFCKCFAHSCVTTPPPACSFRRLNVCVPPVRGLFFVLVL